MKAISKILKEDVIGKYKQTLNIIVVLDKTRHADDRRYRHGVDNIITDNDIINTGKKGLSKISKLLLFNVLNIGDEIIIYDKSNNLNLICVIDNPTTDTIELKIITVMQKKDFKPKPGTKKILV
jgi:hypothetical protein